MNWFGESDSSLEGVDVILGSDDDHVVGAGGRADTDVVTCHPSIA